MIMNRVQLKFLVFFLAILLAGAGLLIAGCGGGGSGVLDKPNYSDPPNPFITPTNFVAVEAEVGTYTISWDAVPGATHYALTRQGGSEVTTYTTASNASIQQSKSAIPYISSISACNSSVCSWSSNIISVNIPSISGYAPSDTANPQINLSWSDSVTQNGSSVSGAVYYIRKNCGQENEVTYSTTSITFYDSNLPPSTSYYYCAQTCYNGNCSEFSTPAVQFTSGIRYELPSTPSGITTTSPNAFQVTVSWSSVSGATTYYTYMRDETEDTLEEKKSTTGTSYTYKGLTKDKTYKFRVEACNPRGCSSKSSYVEQKTNKSDDFTLTASTHAVGAGIGIPFTLSGGAGTYSVSHTVGALKTTSISDPTTLYINAFVYAILSYVSSDGGSIYIKTVKGLDDLLTTTPISIASSGSDLFTLYVETGSTSDNTDAGQLVISRQGIDPQGVGIAGYGNTVQLTSSNALQIKDLIAGTYNVKAATGNATSNGGTKSFKNVILMYFDSTGREKFISLDIGSTSTQEITINTSTMYAFLIDNDKTDNTGTVTINLEMK